MKCSGRLAKLFIGTLCIIVLAGGCRPTPPRGPGSGSLAFGDGRQMMQDVLDEALRGYTFEDGGRIDWSGGGNSKDFSVYEQLRVKNTTVKEVAEKLKAELRTLPARRGWKSHSSGGLSSAHGTRILSLKYEERGARYFFDIHLEQNGADVQIYILHKGVR